MLFMKEKKSMSQKIIEAELLAKDDVDVLRFFLETDEVDINLNTSNCQAELKLLFSKLLEELLENDLVIEFKCGDEYTRGMYIEVCEEYIKDLNKELQDVKEQIKSMI